ncbi:MAG TPA: septum formation family protein [Acidimicrobiales bacterium]|nr:septum formation family protein [Acidimicrobiales bacterium]
MADVDTEPVEQAPRRRRRAVRGALLVALAAGLAAAGVAVAGRRSGPSEPARTAADAPPGTGSDGTGGATSSTTSGRLVRRSYQPGDCVDWSDSGTQFLAGRTEVVTCDRPHVLEVTGRYQVVEPSLSYPKPDYWDALFASGACHRLGEAYLGAPLDPEGNYYVHGLLPTADGWAHGDREVWCGLGVRPYDAQQLATGGNVPSTGRVEAGGQYRLYPAGSCLGDVPGTDGPVYGVVPCESPHDQEVSGYVDIAGRAQQLPGADGWYAVAGKDCERVGRAYAGAALRDPVVAVPVPFGAASWDAGRRQVMCVLAQFHGQDIVTVTRRIRP